MIVKMSKRKKAKAEKPELSIQEKECLKAIGEILDENGGRIPTLAEIGKKLGGRVKAARVSQMRQSLKKKGYYSEWAEVAS